MKDFKIVLDNLYYLDKYREASTFFKGDANVCLRELDDSKAKQTLGHLAKELQCTTKWLLRTHNYENKEEMIFDRMYDKMIVKIRSGLCVCKYDTDLEQAKKIFGDGVIDVVELISESSPFTVAICKVLEDGEEVFRLFLYKIEGENVTVNPLLYDTASRHGLCKICYNAKPKLKKPIMLDKPELINQVSAF